MRKGMDIINVEVTIFLIIYKSVKNVYIMGFKSNYEFKIKFFEYII